MKFSSVHEPFFVGLVVMVTVVMTGHDQVWSWSWSPIAVTTVTRRDRS
jgi:hypothetical protein